LVGAGGLLSSVVKKLNEWHRLSTAYSSMRFGSEADAAQDDMIVEGERYLVEYDGGQWCPVSR
jgi:hypothetical protein